MQIAGDQYAIPAYQYQNGFIPPYSNYVTFGYTISSATPASFSLVNNACSPPASCPSSLSTSVYEWSTNTALVQQYNLQITNTGSSAIANANVLISFSSGSYVSNSWNLAPSTTSPGASSATLTCSLWNMAPGQTSSSCGYPLFSSSPLWLPFFPPSLLPSSPPPSSPPLLPSSSLFFDYMEDSSLQLQEELKDL